MQEEVVDPGDKRYRFEYPFYVSLWLCFLAVGITAVLTRRVYNS